MKYLSLFLVLISIIFFAAPVSAIDFNAHSGVQFNWWDSDDDRKATQINIPITFEGKEGKYSISLLAGFTRTSIELADGTDESLSTILDTKLNLSYEVPGDLPVDVLIGLDFNIPTGKTNLSQDELILLMDPDLISITTFGEGFNVNPSVNIVKKWKDWVAGFGIGYLYRGEYDFSVNTTEYNPGDIINASAEARYYSLSSWDARVFGYYAYYLKDKLAGDDFAQEGSHYLIGAGLNYDQVEWVAGASLSAVFRDKSKFQEATGGLFTEGNNSQGNELIGDLYFTYELDKRTVLTSTFQGLFISENDYGENSSRFIGSRKKFTLGVGASRTYDKSLTAEVDLKGFMLKDEKTNFPVPLGNVDYKGIVASITASKSF